MANKTDPLAVRAHGTDPQFLVEKITREKIYSSLYWKEECFGLSTSTLIEKAVKLQYACGLHGTFRTPSPFLCLTLKMLQLAPEKDIVVEFINQEDFKYVRVLGAFYLRLVGNSVDVFQNLEPLLEDFRKIRLRTYDSFEITHVDEIVEKLLSDSDIFDTKLPRLANRAVLVQTRQIPKRISPLADEIDALVAETEEKEAAAAANGAKPEDTDGEIKETDESLKKEESERAGDAEGDRKEKKKHRTEYQPEEEGRKHSSRGRSEERGHRDRDSKDRERERYRDRDGYRREDGELDDRRDRERYRDRDRDRRRDRERDRRRDEEDEDDRRGLSRRHRRSRSRSRSLDRDSYRRRRDRGRRSRSRSRDRYRRRSRSRSRSRDRRRREGSRSRGRDRRRSRSRSRDRDRHGNVASGKSKRKEKEPKPKEQGDAGNENKAAAPEGSVEYWNEMRAKLGLKPLKQ